MLTESEENKMNCSSRSAVIITLSCLVERGFENVGDYIEKTNISNKRGK